MVNHYFFKYLIVFSALQLLEPLDLGDGQALNLALQHGLVTLLDRRVLRTRGHQVGVSGKVDRQVRALNLVRALVTDHIEGEVPSRGSDVVPGHAGVKAGVHLGQLVDGQHRPAVGRLLDQVGPAADDRDLILEPGDLRIGFGQSLANQVEAFAGSLAVSRPEGFGFFGQNRSRVMRVLVVTEVWKV